MARFRAIRPVAGTIFTVLLLTLAPWSHRNAYAATGTPATQTLTMTVLDNGVLTVTATSSTVSWTYPNAVDLGKLDFTNTLNNTSTWNVTAAMTDLVPTGFTGTCSNTSTNCLSYTNVGLSTSSIFNKVSGATTTNMVRFNSNTTFGGSDDAPGITMSNPKLVLTAGSTDKGHYIQGDGTPAGDNNLQPTGSLSLESGTYSGTLQYTIMG